MKEIFLSASIPVEGRGDYFKTSEPYLIQLAVKELAEFAFANGFKLVWGGHPAITPMIESICLDMNCNYKEHVLVYQSKFFEGMFPSSNKSFESIKYTKKHSSIEKSLFVMRREMISRENIVAAVFIGGMEGIFQEYKLFSKYQRDKVVIALGITGGATQVLSNKLKPDSDIGNSANFSRIYREKLKIE
ncbi:hypothetical protein AB6C54_18600 [Vibrio splendidus]